MKITVIGKSKVSKAEAKYATRFFCRELMSPQLMKNIIIHLIFDRSLKKYSGEMDIGDNWQERPRFFNIYIKPNGRTVATQISSIGHEVVHIWQYATGKMKMMLIGPCDHRFGKRYYNEADIAYRNRPWEKEAYKLEPKLYKKYKEHKKKHNITFPK